MSDPMDKVEGLFDERPIHILEVAGNAIVGGMEKYVYNLTQYLPSYQFKVTCVAPYESFYTASLRDLGSEVFITTMENDPPWRSIQFLAELVKHHRVDLIHAHLPRAHVLSGLVGRLTNKPVIATIHGMDVTAHELGISRTTGTHLIVVCNDAFAQALNLGMPAQRLSLVPNGVDIKVFSPNRSGASFRRTLPLQDDAPLIGFVGRLAWEKGPDQFLQFANVVHQVRPDARFVIVGEGPMKYEIASTIENEGMKEYVHLVGLWKNTWEVYPALDVVVQTSRVEGMPFTVLESLACGKPVAALGVGGVPEIVEVGTCGILSAPSDWKGLANGVLALLNDPEQLKEMGHNARKRVIESFDLQDSVRLTANVFRHLLGRKVPKESILPVNWTATGRGETPDDQEKNSQIDVEQSNPLHKKR